MAYVLVVGTGTVTRTHARTRRASHLPCWCGRARSTGDEEAAGIVEQVEDAADEAVEDATEAADEAVNGRRGPTNH